MKTITMDFETYQRELADARQTAVMNAPILVQKLNDALKQIDQGNCVTTYNDFYNALGLIRQVREALKGIEQ